MTKLKNTKKGMAKKALSISLVAAMLATSNVPVWAAEFSDGTEPAPVVVEENTDVEAFSAEEAPVAEEAVEDVAPLSSVVSNNDLTVSLTADKKSVVWGGDITVSGTIIPKVETDINGKYNPDDSEYVELVSPKYRWVDSDGIVPKYNKEGTTKELKGTVTVADDGKITDISLSADKELAGKTLTLYVYNNIPGPDGANYDINTGITVTIDKKALKQKDGFQISVNNLTYKGFAQSIKEDEVSDVKDVDGGSLVSSEYTVTSTSATQAKDKVVVTVTAKPDSAYTGSSSKEIEISRSTDESGIEASAVEGQTFQYTGRAITVPTDKVALKETKSSNGGEDSKFSGADVSSAIKSAETIAKDGEHFGDVLVKVTIDPKKLDNFDITETEYTTTEKVKIDKRDLSTAGTKITVDYGKVNTGTDVSNLGDVLTFTGVEGTKLGASGNGKLTQDTDYELTVKTTSGEAVTTLDKTGTYVVTVTAKDGTHFKGNQTFNVKTVGNVLQSVIASNIDADNLSQSTYAPYYTGSAITPSKSDLGDLTVSGSAGGKETLQASEWEITGYTNNTNATTYKTDGTVDKTAAVNIKILSGKYAGETTSIKFVIKALEVKADYITVPKTVSYNKNYTEAKEYNVPITVVAKDSTGKIVKTLAANDYTVEYSFVDGEINYGEDGNVDENVVAKNEINDKIAYKVTVTNKNYISGNETDGEIDLTDNSEKMTTIKSKSLTDTMVSVNPSSYVYTGGKITPSYVVMDGVLVLYKDEEYTEVSVTDAVNVGTGKITVEGKDPYYYGKATGTFTITAANTSDVKVSIDDALYTGRQVRPRKFTATLNGNDVTDQFEIVSYGENVKAGKGTVVIKPVAGNKNFTGSNITAEFNIVNDAVTATLKVYDSKGLEITNPMFDFDGNAKTFAKTVISNIKKAKKDETNGKITPDGDTKATVDDLEVKYVDNVCGKRVDSEDYNVGYVYVVAKEGSGFTGLETITTADGTVIKGVIAKREIKIHSVYFNEQNVTIKNAAYAGGLPVKPEILIQIGGATLVEGKDYKVELVGDDKFVDVTNGKVYGVNIEGINGYTNSWAATYTYDDNGNITDAKPRLEWGIDKKNINDCTVTVKDGVVSVLNGYLPVPTTDYTSKNNGDGTYTVTAATTSKNYTGSKTVKADGKAEDEKPDAPMIVDVQVTGNNAKVILSGEVDGATGYDYVISTDRNCITNKDYDKVNKNILTTNTNFTYTQQGTYYAYCHAWKRDENGKKVFGEWSNAYPFVVSAITPEQPGITSVKVSGSTVKVTYTKAANATGYDIVLGSAVKKVNGEMRPVEYGTLVKKVTKGNTVTATFKNVKKGTYYAGLHAYNRTSEDGKKVFSPWSNTKKVTVK